MFITFKELKYIRHNNTQTNVIFCLTKTMLEFSNVKVSQKFFTPKLQLKQKLAS